MADRNEYLEDPMWYVVHTYSGYENKVKTNIDKSIQNLHLEDQILDVQVPVQEVIEVKDGKKKTVQKKLFPGYVLLHMIMNDETWYVVRNTRGVTGFVGPGSRPVPLTDEEVAKFNVETRVEEFTFKVGDTVSVVSGIFEGYEGTITEISEDKKDITLLVYTGTRDIPVFVEAGDIRLAKQ